MILYKFDIEPEEYYKKMIKQNNLCAICHKECSHKKMLSLDHDHDTNKVRGLLCSSCNMALGGFRDNPKILESAISYLKIWGKDV